MPFTRYVLIVSAFFLVRAESLHSQWALTSGIYGNIRAITITDSAVFVGSSCGIFRSTDAGGNWRLTYAGFSSSRIYSFSLTNSTVYAATDEGIYRSSDEGGQWMKVTTAAFNIVVASGTDLLAFPRLSGLIARSTDNGASWFRSDSALAATKVFTISAGGGNVYAGTNNGIFLSTDRGAMWNPLGLPWLDVKAIAWEGTTMYAGTDSNGVFRSTDSGVSWTEVGLTYARVNALSLTGATLLAGTD